MKRIKSIATTAVLIGGPAVFILVETAFRQHGR